MAAAFGVADMAMSALAIESGGFQVPLPENFLKCSGLRISLNRSACGDDSLSEMGTTPIDSLVAE